MPFFGAEPTRYPYVRREDNELPYFDERQLLRHDRTNPRRPV